MPALFLLLCIAIVLYKGPLLKTLYRGLLYADIGVMCMIILYPYYVMIEWQYLFASALITTIPVIILFMFIEKHLVSGLTSGGVKG